MPNQCLGCGTVIPSGSPAILNGCPNCGGRKFFYTATPISEPERERVTEKANRDMNSLVKEILSQKIPEVHKVPEPVPVNRRIIEELELEFEARKEIEEKERERDTIEDAWLEFKFDKPTKSVKIIKTTKKPEPRRATITTTEKEKGTDIITVVEPGVYEIDLERLLDHCPIVVQSDDTYLVHVPSLLDKRYPWTRHQVFELLHKIERGL